MTVIKNAAETFGLSEKECENLANKAGLSFCFSGKNLKQTVAEYKGKYCDLLRTASVSERMFQYYMADREPTKQALAIAIALELSLREIDELLHGYGYCLSKSIPSDVVVSCFLKEKRMEGNGGHMLREINQTLDELGLPVLMTKIYNR